MSKKPKPSRSVGDRFYDRIPVVGKLRRVRVWIKSHRGWFYLILAILIIAIVRPFLQILAVLFESLKPMIRLLLENPVGRFVFYNALAIVLLYWVWRKARGGILRVFGMVAMRRFLDGLNAMILGRWRAAIAAFEKVERAPAWVDLEEFVPEHRDIRRDARIKIANCYHRLGDANQAMAWLKRVREQDILSDHVKRNFRELSALVYDISDELEEETIEQELEKSHSGRGRPSRRIVRALKERAEAKDDLDRTRLFARELVRLTEGREKEELQRELARLEFRIAHKALGDGSSSASSKGLKSALKIDPGDYRSALLLGDIALEKGDVKGALKAWSRAVGLPTFDRLARSLDEGRLDGDAERRMLHDFFPYAGTMLVLAEYHRRKGEFRQAKAALDKVREPAGESLPFLREYAACLQGEGDPEAAAEIYRRALSLSFR